MIMSALSVQIATLIIFNNEGVVHALS
jgi:hypothetical protein